MISLFNTSTWYSNIKVKNRSILRRNKSGYRCRFVQFSQKFMKDTVELFRPFHHRSMPAFIDKVQFTVWDQLVEFLSYEGRGNIVVISPYQQGRVLDLAHLLAQVVPDGALGQGY